MQSVSLKRRCGLSQINMLRFGSSEPENETYQSSLKMTAKVLRLYTHIHSGLRSQPMGGASPSAVSTSKETDWIYSNGKCRTGGMVIWRAGSVMVLYRGLDYQELSVISNQMNRHEETLFVPDVSFAGYEATNAKDNQNAPLEIKDPIGKNLIRKESMTEEEFNILLDNLGLLCHERWATDVPVNSDLLPLTIPGYKIPLTLLPAGMRSNLTNAKMTNLRKNGELTCHFALHFSMHL